MPDTGHTRMTGSGWRPVMRRAAAGIVVLMVAALGLWGALALARPTEGSHSVSWHILERVVISSPGAQVPGISGFPSMSADGRYLAFVSLASNLVPGDTNNQPDVFVRDRQTNQITRVSVASDGTQADNGSALTAISADGRYVAFLSLASNLVPDDTNSAVDVFVHDRQTGVTSRVNVSSGGAQANDLSGSVSISGDGRYVAFNSLASNLVGNDTNGASDIFVHDRQTNSTTRVSVTFDGSQAGGGAPVLSTDGRYVSFVSVSGLVPADTNDNQDVYVYDLLTGTLSRVSVSTGGGESVGHFFNCGISATGRYVVFIGDEFAGDLVPGDTNGVADVYVHDRELNLTQRVSVSTTGAEGNDISACTNAPISADGRYVVFFSLASSLVANDTNGRNDVFVHDRETGTTSRVSVRSDGVEGNAESVLPIISADSHYITFISNASNLVPGDTNGLPDIFIAIADFIADGQPDLTIIKSSSPEQVRRVLNLASAVTYTVIVQNAGTAQADNVLMRDTLPPQTAVASVRTTRGTCAYVSSERTVNCDIGSLAPGESATITIRVLASTTFARSLVNTATIDPDNLIAESNEDNNSATATTTITRR